MKDKELLEYLENYLSKYIVQVPAGQEIITDFIDETKWMSSNSQMSMPSIEPSKALRKTIVDINSFEILKIPVTVGFYNSMLSQNFEEDTRDHPITSINWFKAIEFCNFLSNVMKLENYYLLDSNKENVLINTQSKGFRLLTDAEWQYACRGNSKGYRYGNLDDIGWYNKNSNSQIQSVELKSPNNFGLYDMIGNVWEWCFDIYDEKRYGNYRIFRGGSFASEERACGATSRRKSFPQFEIEDLGFRIARTV